MKESVIVGLSGGVDSSVAAALLKRQGYDVIGVCFKFIENTEFEDAKAVADKLGIKFIVVDYKEQFKKEVIDKFIHDYENGITPNPCVHCNRFVKMKFLYNEMKKQNCDYMATGHYAKNDRGKLYRSVDMNKDQTYFLSSVPQEILNKTLFPLEGITKEEVREIAKDLEIDVYNKKDSTDVCFINNKFNEFITNNIKLTEGNIINLDTNEIIGKHQGLSLYTIGQRKGLNIGGTKDRLFVVGKSVDKNELYVAEGEDNDFLYSNECIINEVNLLGPHHPTFATAKFRYRSKETPVTIEYISEDELKITYMEGVKSVTPGQTCCLYLGEECLGSGTIKEVRKNGEKLWYL